MKILKVGFGNEEEAFIEHRFNDKVNIIYSKDNNKGKTLVMQAILYTLGNEAIFPSGFDYKNYYFYLEISHKNNIYKFLRKRNSIVTLKEDNSYRVCNSISEFKAYLNENIFELPYILKDNQKKLVDPMLFYQIFFIGQDKRNSSNIFNNGLYNKKDFWSMLCSLNGYPLFDLEEDEKQIDGEIKKYKIEVQKLKKNASIFKENPQIASFTNIGADKENFEKIQREIADISMQLSSFRKTRKSAELRKNNLENLIGELNSINHYVEKGIVQCLKCGSKNISYTNGDISFDVSNQIVRVEIIKSINQQIIAEQKIISEAEVNIGIWQSKLQKVLRDDNPSVTDILLYSKDILSSKECDEKIASIIDIIKELKRKKADLNLRNKEANEHNNKMKESILDSMNKHIKRLDPNSAISFTDLFTKNGENYSGSEEQEFYFCKLIALNEYFNHEFPLIVDSFRDGEISSEKEKVMLDEYKNLNKQVILSSTLKNEEYDTLKYEEINGVNAIDYNSHQDNKILQPKNTEKFKEILDMFNIALKNIE